MQITMGAKCWDGYRGKTLGWWAQAASSELVTEKRGGSYKLAGAAVGLAFGLFGMDSGIGMAHPAVESGTVVPAMAISDGLKGTILHAFDPLIDLIVTLSYPIAGVMIAGGCLFIMVGNRERGMQMLQNAAIGYILVQLSPMLLKLLVGIGGSI